MKHDEACKHVLFYPQDKAADGNVLQGSVEEFLPYEHLMNHESNPSSILKKRLLMTMSSSRAKLFFRMHRNGSTHQNAIRLPRHGYVKQLSM